MKKTSLIPTVSNRVFSVSMITAIAIFAVFCMSGGSVQAASAVSDSHSLTATSSGQGTISPSGTFTVTEGASRSFVFEADKNHRMVDVVVDGVSIGPVDAFSFENIRASHTIEAVYERHDTLAAASEVDL